MSNDSNALVTREKKKHNNNKEQQINTHDLGQKKLSSVSVASNLLKFESVVCLARGNCPRNAESGIQVIAFLKAFYC